MICVEENRSPEETREPEEKNPSQPDGQEPQTSPAPEPDGAQQPTGNQAQTRDGEDQASAPGEEPSQAAPKPAFQVNFKEDAFEEFGELVPTQRVEPAPAAVQSKPKRGWVKVTITLVLLAIIGFVCTVVILFLADMMGVNGNDDPITITVEPNTGLNEVSETLHDAGVIEYPDLFKFYVRFMAEDTSIQFGEFELSSDMGYDEIIQTLSTYNRSDQIVTVTIPEGSTVTDIAQILEDNRVCTKDDFYQAVNSTEYQYSFLTEEVLGNTGRYFLLEGYLFPDTYDFYVNEHASEVVETMLDNFADHYTSDVRQAVESSGMSLDQIVVIASVLEAEASGNTQQMANVSSVYHNRLSDSSTYPRLQSDPTTRYAENVIKPFLLEDGVIDETDQALLDSYNTYAGSGLPAGPINNPGVAAILAAAQPADTDYTYFVTSPDGSTFLYASDYRTHLQNCEQLGVNGG